MMIPAPSFAELSIGPFDHIKKQPTLSVRSGTCSDCGVMTGFYAEYVALLRAENAEQIKDISRKWFCHQQHGLACAGICKIADKNAAMQVR